jgi:hypothetical protein
MQRFWDYFFAVSGVPYIACAPVTNPDCDRHVSSIPDRDADAQADS